MGLRVMPSWQARIYNAYLRRFVRRDSWGRDAKSVAERARSTFGAPKFYQWIVSGGVSIHQVNVHGVRGEWIVPRDSSGNGVVLYIHGGGFISCSAATHRPVTAALARMTGRRVFSVEYRLGPEYPFPAALDDIASAFHWLLETGTSHTDIAVAGDSAGGGLVLSLMIRLREEGIQLPACGVCLSAWTDLSGSSESVRANNGKCHMFRPRNIGEFASAYLNGVGSTNELVSPVFADLSSLPPILMQVGSTELLLDDSKLVHEKVTAAGGVCELEIYDDLGHDWHLAVGIVPEANEALRNVSGFISRNSFHDDPEGSH